MNNERWEFIRKRKDKKKKKNYLDGIRPIYMAKETKISTDVVLVCVDIRIKS